MVLRIYDSSGILVLSIPAGSASAAIGAFSPSQDPWDPALGPLTLQDAGWSFSYDGLDANGTVLRNGIYLFEVQSQGGSGVKKQIRILGAGEGRVSLTAAPNPVRPGAGSVRIAWSPSQRVELKVYSLDGSLVRDFSDASRSPVLWDLRNAGGSPIANGIFFVVVRVPGERSPQVSKLLVAR